MMASRGGTDEEEGERRWVSLDHFASTASAAALSGKGDEHVGKFLLQNPLPTLVSCLEEASVQGDEDRIDLMCRVFHHVFQADIVKAKLTQPEFVQLLVQGMHHYHEKVRLVTIKVIKEQKLQNFPKEIQDEALFPAVVERLSDEDAGVALCASDMLLGLRDVSSLRKVLSAMRKLLDSDESDGGKAQGAPKADPTTVQLRAFDIVACVAARSAEELQECQASGVLGPLLDLVKTEDVLLQLNAMHLLPLIGVTVEGFRLLLESHVVDSLLELAGLDEDGHLANPLLGDEALRVMSKISARALDPSLVTPKYEEMATRFLDLAEHRVNQALRKNDAVGAAAAMLLLGSFAGTQPPVSLKLVMDRSDTLKPWMELATSAGERYVVAGLDSLARALVGGALIGEEAPILEHQSRDEQVHMEALSSGLFGKQHGEEDRRSAAELGRELVVIWGNTFTNKPGNSSLGKDPIGILYSYVRKPLQEQRCASFALLRMIAAQDSQWGVQSLFSNPGGEELLLNRSLDMSKQEKEWRFSVIEAVYHNPFSKSTLGDSFLRTKIKPFLMQGPYKGPSNQPQVKLEDAV